ncbi:helix-turn-helix domain-containing protein [Chitinophaga ginsengisoli]|uniref:Helix-turn-helix protein n=1 Tax=Chitinophaga ginsengisoli TaxID=363837 RepID=A0A2P8GCM8_9BACT|nr:helix-turn-helix transcriptional regulator [Chitinophaga ginsengisoli]PSL31716.1 helix-turn-helix protein [Chitinophaga ginsengisoli]
MGAKDKIELQEFGQKIRNIRKEKGLSQRELAALAELEHKQILKIEKGESDIRLTTVLKLIWALEIEPNNILPYQPRE